MAELRRSAARVVAALAAHGIDTEVQELPASTRTATDAAAALGCEIAQITKSLVFRDVESERAVLVLATGPDRVDEDRLARAVGGPVEQAPAAWVKQQTGFAVGGVPPLGHREPLTTVIDEGVLRHELVWAAAGTPHAVFCASPSALQQATGATVAAVAG